MNRSVSGGPGVLLLGGDYYGTLAAARCYGRNGIRVTMADESKRARAGFSRYVADRLVHPPLAEPTAVIDWLLRWGEEHPDTVLYPTNDHLAWLFAVERDRLGGAFKMFSPGEETIMTLLDKKRLYEACGEVGLEVAPSGGAGELRYPLLLKPRTQVSLASGIKGLIVRDREHLASQLARFRKLVAFSPALLARHPDIAEPMVQEYLAVGESNILSISGYVGDDGQLLARASLKMLQRPRKVGIGLCFEGRAVEPRLTEQLAELCRRTGYQGVFESEFIVDGDRRLLIDFNPRFYSQMAFEVARGLPLPLLVWHAARGEREHVAQELARARAWAPSGDEIYCHKTMLDLVLTLQRISGRMSRAEAKQWRGWHRRAARVGAATDAVRDPEDPLPAVVDTLRWVTDFASTHVAS